MPPQWLTRSSLIWSNVPSHHQRYNEAKADSKSIPTELIALEAEISKHADDLVALGVAVNRDPKDAVVRLRHEEKERQHRQADGRRTYRAQRLQQATRTTDHFESTIEQAWARLFAVELPTDKVLETWDDGSGGIYSLHEHGRIVFRGHYDGILIPNNEQPLI